MKKIEKVLDTVMRFLMALAMLTLLVFGTWQIFTRWILGNPSTFTDELLRYVLIIAGFIGSAYCFYRDEHLALTLITDKAKGPFKVVLDIFIEICILFFVIYVFIYGLRRSRPAQGRWQCLPHAAGRRPAGGTYQHQGGYRNG